MSKKALVINIIAHQFYLRHHDDEDSAALNTLFNSLSDIYLPMLSMFADLEAEGIPFKINMVISPTLCALLSDPVIQQQYIEWLDKIIALGENEILNYSEDDTRHNLAITYLEKAKQNKLDFQETLNQDVLSKFAYYARRGNIELLSTAATMPFMPHYADMTEALQAQIETGLLYHKNIFGLAPEGFWLPYMAYTSGLEFIIRAYGFNYTILDTHGLLFATPQPQNGIFTPARCVNSLAVFGSDIDKSIPHANNSVYLNPEKDIGFEADHEYLAAALGSSETRKATGYNYWANGDSGASLYNPEAAKKQVIEDAKLFLDGKAQKLAEAEKLLPGKDVSLVCTFDAKDLGLTWHEGIQWLGQVFRQAAERNDIELSQCSELMDNQFSLQKLSPYISASTGTGYGENMLDNSNDWILRYVRKATARMIDLASRFSDDTGLKARSLNLAAKEVLLAQSGDWAKMLHDKDMPDYADYRVRENVVSFSTVYDSLGANSINIEWLTQLEKKHTLFEEMNYRVFSPRK